MKGLSVELPYEQNGAYTEEGKVSDGKLCLSFWCAARDLHGEVLVRLQVARIRVGELRVIRPIVKNCAELCIGRRTVAVRAA